MKIFRKRFIPNEIVDISKDELVFRDEKKLITKWLPIKPREDIGRGESCVYFDLGVKVSKVFDLNGNFKYWYCDIISSKHDPKCDTYVLTDLLLDVILYEDGHFEILDEDELEEALRENIITKEIYLEAIRKKENLVKIIEDGDFNKLRF